MSICKLSEDIINKIAAGQVVQRPSNAIKELIENSIDAESTALNISIAEGGLRDLTVIDNGKGVLLEDFPLLCERFATSKLRTIEDLTHIGSFGFRGEALASLSYVAEVKVTSKTKDREQAYTASFKDGKLLGEPSPHFLNSGTVITCQDLFNCLQVRRQSLKPTDEKRRIIKIVNVFSLHYSWVRFKLTCDNKVEVNTQGIAGHDPQIQLRIFSKIYDLPLDSFVRDSNIIDSIEVKCILTKLKLAKTKTITLIVNNRIVEIPEILSAVDEAYCNLYNSIHYSDITYTVYLSLTMDPMFIDCNVHPTKKTVHIINCSLFCKKLTDWILGVLKKVCKITPFTAPIQQTLIFEQEKNTGSKGVPKRNDAKARVDGKQLSLKYYLPESSRRDIGVVEECKKPQFKQPKQEEKIIKRQNCILQVEEIAQQTNEVKPNTSRPNIIPTKSRVIQNTVLETPFTLDIKVEEPCPKTKQFFRNLVVVSCLNIQYLLIQLDTSLKMINLLPFLPSMLITWLTREKKVLVHRLQTPFRIAEELHKFSRQTNLKFDIAQYTQVLIDNRDTIQQILKVAINSDGEVTQIPAPMDIVRQKLIPKQLSYLLARVAKSSITHGETPQRQKLHRYLIEYFVTLFEQPFESYNPVNRMYDSFYEHKFIPLMKDKGEFEKVDFNRYTAQMLNLKAAYKVFERC